MAYCIETLYKYEFQCLSDPLSQISDPLSQISDVSLADGGKDFATIPVAGLCHSTHTKQYGDIMATKKNQQLYFKPYECTGKQRGTRVLIQDESDTIVKNDRKIFPGFLSWWSIDSQYWYNTVEGQKFEEKVAELKEQKIYVPYYIDSPPSSKYGKHNFSMTFEDIVDSYRKSRGGSTVCFLKAGTLKYNYVVCYVVMVCIMKDRKSEEELSRMPVLHIDTGDRTFQSSLSFKARSLITAIYNWTIVKDVPTNYCFEEMAFAFYFENEDDKLECDSNKIKHSRVDHKPIFCAKKPCQDQNAGQII